MTKEQEKQREISRQEWLERLDTLVKNTKRNHDDEEFMHVGDLIDLIYQIPEYDLSDEDRKKYLKKLGSKV